MDDGSFNESDGGEERFFLAEDVEDETIDAVIDAVDSDLTADRSEETDPLAAMLGELSGDPAWAERYSSALAQLDSSGVGVLETAEKRQLLRSLARAMGEDGFNFEQFFGVLDWANRTRANQIMLEMVLDGQLDVSFDEQTGSVSFSAPAGD